MVLSERVPSVSSSVFVSFHVFPDIEPGDMLTDALVADWSIASLKIMVTFVVLSTFVAPFEGVVLCTVGGVVSADEPVVKVNVFSVARFAPSALFAATDIVMV